MAKAAAAKASAKPKRKGGGRSTFLLFALLVGAIMLVQPAVGLVLAVGLAPSLVALFTEIGPLRGLRMRTIFLFNIAGVLPLCVKYWRAGDVSLMVADMSQLYIWVVMYGGAMIGYFLLWLCPQIAAAIVQSANQDKLKRMDKAMRDLREEWGADVME